MTKGQPSGPIIKQLSEGSGTRAPDMTSLFPAGIFLRPGTFGVCLGERVALTTRR